MHQWVAPSFQFESYPNFNQKCHKNHPKINEKYRPGATWGPLEGVLRPSCRYGAVLGRLGVFLGRLGAFWGPSWGRLAAVLGCIGASWGRLGAVLGPS